MLTKLEISNYALIDHVELLFSKGLTIITGETGAGKSIILGALSMILGEKGDPKVVRDKSKKSVIEATFDISNYNLEEFFSENDIDYFANECILRKEFSNNGRSRVFVNDSPVSMATMKEIAINLIDIHSQHSNLLISKPLYQLNIIDNLAFNKDLLSLYRDKYQEYQKLSKQLEEARRDFEKGREDEDYIRFQLRQLKELNLSSGEDIELEAEQNVLSNLTEIKESLWAAESLLNSEENSVIDNLKSAAKSVSVASENFNEVKELAERLESAVIEIKDISQAISASQEGLDYNPEELERINDRLNAIYSLETKHSVASVDELLELQAEYERKIDAIDNSDELIVKLENLVKSAYKEAKNIANKLSVSRKNAAIAFAEELKSLAIPLGLKNTQFAVEFSEQDLSSSGIDAVKFMIAFNKNQPLMPIETTASGGELSRLMLSIKTIIAKSMSLPTIIFDEVDTGVSGEVAEKIGDMMANLSKRIQVVAITHLPQVASKGDNHIKVYKTDDEETTTTMVKTLNNNERIEEIAGMLSGSVITQSAIDNAISLLNNKK